MRMLFAALITVAALPAAAADVDEKRCVFGSALQLPSVPKLEIKKVVASPLTQSAKYYPSERARSAGSSARRARSIVEQTKILTASDIYELNAADGDEIKMQIAVDKALGLTMSSEPQDIRYVSIDVVALGYDATFVFRCATTIGRPIEITAQGLVK